MSELLAARPAGAKALADTKETKKRTTEFIRFIYF
jgi:hypothetical protein